MPRDDDHNNDNDEDEDGDDDDDDDDDDTVDDTWVICTKDALSAATQTPTVSTSPPTLEWQCQSLKKLKKYISKEAKEKNDN